MSSLFSRTRPEEFEDVLQSLDHFLCTEVGDESTDTVLGLLIHYVACQLDRAAQPDAAILATSFADYLRKRYVH